MWMWAGRAEGVRETIDVDGREVVLETLDLSPRLFRLHGLLTPNEIAEIRRAADAQGWAPSVSFDPDTGREYSLAEGRRRAHTAWVGTEYGFKRPDLVTNEALERLQRRAADAARVHVGHAEPWQVVKYDVGDGQLHHIDGLKTAHGSTRSVTVLVYLTTVTEGGATNFPFAAGGNGDIDEPGSARHAACRLESGEKLIANIWVHDTPVNESLAVSASCDKFASSLGERVPAAGGAGAMAGASVARGPRWLWCEEEMRRELGLFEVRGALHRRR
ncbi:prolyl 4-hydroxylase alpha subunit precursor [Chrysochromulina tobinii]|uniref:Prolyl 4-hydroxylase alpha subunit n=1 Tax=Chrysochromulina tobinii TaxID=1460289 RepID=A0A0M0K8T7_9EUKA|nr:prolyl 4-hydroxylase alpha subunit precursor [Chrysochromulina tobinii]|eukprot:KOO34813.1 prolyl 4-hydroxylase alpha subunit precursor [Chrysochromulina sp. CCMP291]